jgi:hypothetical protein
MSGGTRYTDMVHYTFAQQLERELANQAKQVDAVARWIEHNHPDALVDSEPLEYQLEKIRERDFVLIGSYMRKLVDALEQRDKLAAALRTAFSLIVRHHKCGVMPDWGGFCQVCHRKDGTEPEMDEIVAALAKMAGYLAGPN